MLKEGCVKECPGCAHRKLTAEESEERKMEWLANCLEPWQAKLHHICGLRGDDRWGYRNRVCLSAKWCDREWKFGMIRRDELIPIPNCPIQSERVNKTMSIMASVLPEESALPVVYYVQSGAQVVIVAKTDQYSGVEWIGDDLWANLQKNGVEGVWLHLFPSAGKKVFAKNSWHLIRGKMRSVDDRGLVYGPAAFQQPVSVLYQNALDKAVTFLAPQPGDCVVDLYSGNGSTMRCWAEKGATVAGVELGGESVECARENVPSATILRGSCETRIPQLSEWIKESVSRDGRKLLYVNPPRTGLEPKVAEWITAQYQPEKIGYLSCSAGTLRRDLDYLVHSGYRVESIQPYDFFPQTIHVETLVLLSR